ncbi:LADA_0D00672g1_1 [Lachancea dasiensis]|uniref:LADA_0D00672g1_1 n=1 Tax=Lachancea dasiensis TaxID=1072105 RepID=A0A1G4J455_9SACH|nr:LADA_0D00672g1_1 [Lachancea dasiensis]
MHRGSSATTNDGSASSGSRLPSSLTRFSFHKQLQQFGGSGSFHGTSPKVPSRYPVGGFPPSMDSLKEDHVSESKRGDGHRNYVNPGQIRSSGLKYTHQAPKELSSIDKINDPQSKAVVVAGKNHLGLYRFTTDNNDLSCVHDFLSNKNDRVSMSVRAPKKISTISDVKAGFQNYNHYVAICGTSTSVSIYDITKVNSSDSPLNTVLSKHSRSINSVDFNMSQSSLIVSGGQDGCLKIWDLRSSRGNKGSSDLSINGGSDSVRDVKWMPSYDFINYDSTPGLASRGHRLASIHDSGQLLTYDLRQPTQAEKRINAHSGPGLCLSWHPLHEYIMTGGRDGKCCLWNVSGKYANANTGNPHLSSFLNPTNNSSILTPGYSLNSLVTAPEVIVNTAHPLTKLKFQPAAVDNIFNSVIALSSLGENSDISLYSLSREFIPRNVLTTRTPSCGFVWWDENLVFNIDKQNTITGWDLSREPTVLDNLTKNVVGWRDIEGDGMLFLAQEKGTYTMPEKNVEASHENHRTSLQSKMSTSSVHNLFANSGIRHNSSTSSFPALASRHGSSATFGERPSFPRNGTSHNSKSINTQAFGSLSSQNGPHHNSIVSASSSSTTAELPSEEYISPRLMALDLPQILNSIIGPKSRDTRARFGSADVSTLKESPVEVFKFLAKELKFSYMQERLNTKFEVKSGESLSDENNTKVEDDIDLKTHLINQFGLAEDNTWTKFIRSDNTSQEKEPISNQGYSVKISEDSESSFLRTTESSESSSIPNEPARSRNEVFTEELKLKKKIEHYIELISMCDHNAETYLFVEDLNNFKIWVMMRDALVWDLKQVAEKFKLEATGSPFETVYENKNGMGPQMVRKNSAGSEYSSFSASEASSIAPHGLSKHQEPNQSAPPSKQASSSSLSVEMGASLTNEEPTSVGGHKGRAPSLARFTTTAAELDELRRQKSANEESSESAIEDDELSSDCEGDSRNNSTSSMPIVPQSGRKISFIDNFMTNLRSPRGGMYEGDPETSRTSNSMSTKRSSHLSHGSSFAGLISKKHWIIQQEQEVTQPV